MYGGLDYVCADDDLFHKGAVQVVGGSGRAGGGVVLHNLAVCRHKQGSGAAGGVYDAQVCD